MLSGIETQGKYRYLLLMFTNLGNNVIHKKESAQNVKKLEYDFINL